MSHRISMERAKELTKKNEMLKKLQQEGKTLPRNDRRRKKYLAMIRKQEGFIAYLKAKGGYYKKKEKKNDK